MSLDAVWIIGQSRSGKTTRAIAEFCQRWEILAQSEPSLLPGVLAFAANGDNRIDLADRLEAAMLEPGRVQTTTPLGFFTEEVVLFWPLLVKRLNLRVQFPLRLRPETEQELATRLWRNALNEGVLKAEGVKESRLVRRALDLIQLAAVSLTPIEDIPAILAQGMGEGTGLGDDWEAIGELLLSWRNWCLEKGLLTYGIISELYGRYLLEDPTYQQALLRRYHLLLADDVDEYPAIARHLFDFFLDHEVAGIFTYNEVGGIRLGLGADPKDLAKLAKRCRREVLSYEPSSGLAAEVGKSIVNLAVSLWNEGFEFPATQIQSLQTFSRGQILRQTAQTIITAVETGEVQPQDIAIIAPGLDAIARYSLIRLLSQAGIAVEPLNEQRPLISSPLIRGLLTLLALVYPGRGRLIDRDAIAEMLVVLSQKPVFPPLDAPSLPDTFSIVNQIDPVRAGLLADHCYEPHLEHPRLLPATEFPRWDRLGYQATTAYAEILAWVEKQREQLENHLIASPIVFLDRAIQQFFWGGSYLPYDQLSAIRELMETAQHYWEIAARVKESTEKPLGQSKETLTQFIQLLRQGTVTANPYPVKPMGLGSRAITLATIFQYRSSRRSHRWHFWLDAGSHLWLKGGAATLYGAPLFLQDRLGKPWTTDDETEAETKRLQRILYDLLARCQERLYLCHSELAVNGTEQTGPLVPLVNAVVGIETPVLGGV